MIFSDVVTFIGSTVGKLEIKNDQNYLGRAEMTISIILTDSKAYYNGL